MDVMVVGTFELKKKKKKLFFQNFNVIVFVEIQTRDLIIKSIRQSFFL